jgi:hypothetical protein
VTLVRAAEEQKPAAPEQKPAEPEEKPLGPGWLSLDCCVGPVDNAIGNAKGAVEKALGIGISGFFDVGWNFSTNHSRGPGRSTAISLRYFDQDQNKVVFNDFHLALDKPEKDWGVGFHISGDFGRTGELLREATFYGTNKFRTGIDGLSLNGGEPSAELREAYVTTTIPLGEGIGIKGGLFVTPLGTEILPNPGAYNDNISRSFLFNWAIPLRHLGVLFSYPVHKMVGLSLGVVTGWDDPHDNNHQPSFLGGLTVTPNDMLSLVSNIVYGPEQFHKGGPKRLAWANVFTIKPFDPMAISLEYTLGHEDRATASFRGATWQGVSGIVSYGWTDRFTTAFRAEWFNDRDGVRLGGDQITGRKNVGVGEVTLTTSYKFTKMLLGRAEVRQDWSDRSVFGVGALSRATNHSDKAQTTLALQMLYQF